MDNFNTLKILCIWEGAIRANPDDVRRCRHTQREPPFVEWVRSLHNYTSNPSPQIQ